MEKINPSEITPEHLYISRRKFLTGAGALMASALLLNGCEKREPPPPGLEGEDYCASAEASRSTDELGDELTPCEDIISYNNFYEFTTSKTNVDKLARNFRTTPWTLQVGGLVNKPKTYDIDDLLRKFPPEERIYRLRCVEAWSMVIPWLGFPLAKLLKEVEPTSKAKYVRFETLYDPEQMAYNARLCTQITHPHLIAPCVSHT